MTHSPDLAWQVRALAPSNVGYFRNTVHRPGETCLVCRTFVDGYPRCFACNAHRSVPGIADRVATVAYAWNPHQSGRVMYGYKGRAGREVTQLDVGAVMLLGLVALALHGACCERLAGSPITH